MLRINRLRAIAQVLLLGLSLVLGVIFAVPGIKPLLFKAHATLKWVQIKVEALGAFLGEGRGLLFCSLASVATCNIFFSSSVFRLEVSVRGTSGDVWEQLYVCGLVRTGAVNCGLLADLSLAPPSGWGGICA